MKRTGELPAVSLLVLARLLPPGEKGETRDKVDKDLRPLVSHRWEGERWAEHFERTLGDLEASGHLARARKGKSQRVTLTDAGRRLALDALGLSELPPKTTWAKLKSPYLLAVALGRPGPSGVDVTRLSGAPGLKAELLRVGYELPLGDRPTIKQATAALADSLLGLDLGGTFTPDRILVALLRREGIELRAGQKPTATSIQDALFRRELGDLDEKKPLERIVARSVGARTSKAADLGEAALRSWVGRSEEAAPAEERPRDQDEARPEPIDLQDFARRVQEAARSSASGWFGDGKVFIAHVRRALREDPALRGMDDAGFKLLLIEAHRARLIELGRGDLIEAMDPVDVRESATPDLNAVYHFIRTDGGAR